MRIQAGTGRVGPGLGDVNRETVPVRPAAVRPAAVRQAQPDWLAWFVGVHLLMQLLLIVPALTGVRPLLRFVAFGTGLLLIFVIPAHRRENLPARFWCLAVIAILALEFLHPDASSALAAAAQVSMYTAVLSPVFWVPRSVVTPRALRNLMVALWLYYSAGALLGVLQSYFPGRFQPELSAIIAEQGRDYVASLQIRLTSGEHVFRPMGLTTVPGGASYAALYAILLGTGVLLLPKSPFLGAKPAAIGTMMVGLMCLYLCQVR